MRHATYRRELSIFHDSPNPRALPWAIVRSPFGAENKNDKHTAAGTFARQRTKPRSLSDLARWAANPRCGPSRHRAFLTILGSMPCKTAAPIRATSRIFAVSSQTRQAPSDIQRDASTCHDPWSIHRRAWYTVRRSVHSANRRRHKPWSGKRQAVESEKRRSQPAAVSSALRCVSTYSMTRSLEWSSTI